jgi:hypothetical protein
MSATYIYAIIPTPGSVGADTRYPFDVAGVDPDHDQVYCIPHNDMAAVVSASPLADYRGLNRKEAAVYLVAHQRVVETVMRSSPLLPVKFGTVLPRQADVCHLLAQGEALFRTALGRFAGLTQMEVVVLWNLRDIFEEIGQQEPIVRLKAQVASRPPEETVSERVIIGQVVHALLEQRRAALCDHLLTALRELALDIVVNPPMDDSMVVNVALLVNHEGHKALDQRLELLDQEHGGRLLFRCVGPLPLYSFATVEVQTLSFQEVDGARRQLGLGVMATPGDIKQAYHQMAIQLHPDHSPNDPKAESRMAELAQAYHLLTDYTEGQGRGIADPGQATCRFDRQAVEGTLRIAVRRQEIGP